MLINFFGKRGSGKTTAINGQLQDCRGPVIVLDLLGNFQNKDGMIFPYTQCDDTGEGISALLAWLELPDDRPEKELTKIIVVKCDEPNLTLDYLCAALWEAEQGTLVLDEVDGFSITESPWFDKVIRYGRNKNIDLVTGCRRPAEISRNITAGANKLFAFQTQEPRDVEYFRTTLFGDRAEELMSLDKYHGLYIDYDEDVMGNFFIDIEGQVFILDSVPINKPSKNNQPNQELE